MSNKSRYEKLVEDLENKFTQGQKQVAKIDDGCIQTGSRSPIIWLIWSVPPQAEPWTKYHLWTSTVTRVNWWEQQCWWSLGNMGTDTHTWDDINNIRWSTMNIYAHRRNRRIFYREYRFLWKDFTVRTYKASYFAFGHRVFQKYGSSWTAKSLSTFSWMGTYWGT